MALTRWQPMRELSRMREDMDKLFEDFFSTRPERTGLLEGAWHPSVDISETDDEIIAKAELPGLTHDDINISLTDSILTLKGEKKQEKEDKGENYHRVERNYGSFQRTFTLPASVQSENTKAAFRNGVLTINIPKTEEAKPKEIKINVE